MQARVLVRQGHPCPPALRHGRGADTRLEVTPLILTSYSDFFFYKLKTLVPTTDSVTLHNIESFVLIHVIYS